MKRKAEDKPKTDKTTQVVKSETGAVKITHSQSMTQSINYNSANAQYGVELYCPDNDSDIYASIARAEKLVEEALTPKIEEHRKDLKAIANGELD